MHPALQGLVTIIIGVGGCVGYFVLSNYLLDRFLLPARAFSAEQTAARRKLGTIFLFAIPSVLIAIGFLMTDALFSVQGFLWLVLAGALILGLWRLNDFVFGSGATTAGRNISRANMIRPWLFLLPAMVALGLYLTYPVFETFRLSFTQRIPGGYEFVGVDNYTQMMSEPKFWEAMRNNMLWLFVVPAMSTAMGLIVAQLTDRISWGNIAKMLIFMPMAISFVGASVIWKLMYDARPAEQDQIGVLNAIWVSFGGEPQQWLTLPIWNSFFLMVVLIWIQTGFAMVILSAALRGIPEETVEAAIVDGAGPFTIFFKIKVPQIMPTIVVVWTTITLTVLKVFDIVFAMTNGQWGTQVLANYMYDKLFRANDWGVGSAAAMVIMLLVTPILVMNVRNARREMK
ncbi:maltose ABC transporter membrane protein /trehalose ABC transporter membrane protein /sucrose ABC transporter membrane protein [Aliiruegeria haliotis]|uniref:Maltose ABC transporter membrane protein /trehalose ABC transporter membrane protein /sucrose ABC transporter membrane protein n=1 Tax=Aliiruegeria haliotis TaxID=1280846 RepID=A0A2T0S0N3_9RHOB|nr:sugar ABC transporter permease [Aliiruegeria haliotis]PRY26989.1 maltose ABC transporter membrane protein /trehalose ABC transporter membrane protein /sucrose ABC transporter membrane protein [Aliiruegeria haliotis]